MVICIWATYLWLREIVASYWELYDLSSNLGSLLTCSCFVYDLGWNKLPDVWISSDDIFIETFEYNIYRLLMVEWFIKFMSKGLVVIWIWLVQWAFIDIKNVVYWKGNMNLLWWYCNRQGKFEPSLTVLSRQRKFEPSLTVIHLTGKIFPDGKVKSIEIPSPDGSNREGRCTFPDIRFLTGYPRW